MSSLYDVLGVSKSDSCATIKKAFLKLARVHHPDKGGDPEKFKEIQQANEILTDESRRRIYDETGMTEEMQDGFPGFPGFPGGFPGVFPVDINSFFGNMFGNQTGQGKGTVRKSKKPAPAVQNIPVTLEQFYLGHTHLITINRQSFCRTCQNTGAKTKEICKGCNGQGTSSQTIQMGPAIMQVHSPCLECGTKGEKVIEICGACSGTGFTADKRVLSVRIQPGTKPSEKFVFPEVCSDDPSYESPGDIEIHLYEDPNDPTYKRFKRVGDRLQHLETVMEISLAESLLGCTVQLEGHPGYDEPIFLKIPAGSFTGDRYLVRELGMPIKGSQYGDLYLIIKVNVTAAERKKVSQEVVPLIEPLFQEGVRKTDSKEEVVHTELILQ